MSIGLDPMQLRELLAQTGLLSRSQLDVLLKEAQAQNIEFRDHLIASKLIKDEDIRQLEAHALSIPLINLVQMTIPFSVLSLIPEPIARTHNVVAFRHDDEVVDVAVLTVADLEHIQFLKESLRVRLRPHLTTETSMRSALLQYQKGLKQSFGDDIAKDVSRIAGITRRDMRTLLPKDLEQLVSELPVVRLLETIVRHAVFNHATFIHIESTPSDVLVRYRIHNTVRDSIVLSPAVIPLLIARLKFLAGLSLAPSTLPTLDGRVVLEISGEEVAVRFSIMNIADGERITMRVLPATSLGFALETLGFQDEQIEQVHHGLGKNYGLTLVAGAKQSGKSSLIYTLLDILNIPSRTIGTIEETITHTIPRVLQVVANPKLGFTVAHAFRALIKQDSDVIVIDEKLDAETMKLAMTATVHAGRVIARTEGKGAADAIVHWAKSQKDSVLLASVLRLSIGTVLVPRLAGATEKYYLDAVDIKALAKLLDLERLLAILKQEKAVDMKATWESIPFYRPRKGTPAGKGFDGSIGLHEVLLVSESVASIIRVGGAKVAALDIEKQAQAEGMVTLLEDGLRKAVRGYTTLDEVLKATQH